jgi:hypothetical protein
MKTKCEPQDRLRPIDFTEKAAMKEASAELTRRATILRLVGDDEKEIWPLLMGAKALKQLAES